jgi:hypothetical protein
MNISATASGKLPNSAARKKKPKKTRKAIDDGLREIERFERRYRRGDRS